MRLLKYDAFFICVLRNACKKVLVPLLTIYEQCMIKMSSNKHGFKTADQKEQSRCCRTLSADTWVHIWIVVAIVILLLTLAVVAYLAFTGPTRDSQHRVCPWVRADYVPPVYGGSGEPGANFRTRILMDWDANTITYTVRTPNDTSSVTAIHFRGPTPLLSEDGPMEGALCGYPTLACDLTTTPGQISGTLSSSIVDDTHPSGVDIRTVIEAMRASPELYYVEILTADRPVSPGAARGWMTEFCGYP